MLGEFDFTLQLEPDLATKLTDLGEWAKTQKSIEPTTALPNYADFLDGQYLSGAAS